MYFLAKNLRCCSRALSRGNPPIPHPLQKYLPTECNRFTRLTSSCIHPEQMKRLIKERDAHMLCKFFDSDEYKSKVTKFLEKQSKLLVKETVSKVRPNQVKIQHVLSCARPDPVTKNVKPQKCAQETKLENTEDNKIIRAKKTTILQQLIKKKAKEANLKCETDSHTAIVQPIMPPKKIRTKTTIMPIFLKKMNNRNMKNLDENQENVETSPDNISECNFDLNSASVLHKANVHSRGLKTLTPRKKSSKISTTLIPKKQVKNMNLKSYSQLLLTKPVKNKIYNMNSDSYLLSKNQVEVRPPKVKIVKAKNKDSKVEWPPKYSKKIENLNLQKYTLDMLMNEVQKTERNDKLERKNTIKMILNNTVKITKPKRKELVFCNLFEQVKLGTMKKQQSTATIHTLPKYQTKRPKAARKEKSIQDLQSFTYKIVSKVKKCKEKELKESFEPKSFQNRSSFLKESIKSGGASKIQTDIDSTKAAIVSNLSKKPFVGNIVTSRRIQPNLVHGYHTRLKL